MLFANNLPDKITKEQIFKVFDWYGQVEKVIPNDENSAYIIYKSYKETLKANYVLKEEKQLTINKRPIEILLIDKTPKTTSLPKVEETK